MYKAVYWNSQVDNKTNKRANLFHCSREMPTLAYKLFFPKGVSVFISFTTICFAGVSLKEIEQFLIHYIFKSINRDRSK
jgi:hypothetical protein